MNPRIRESYEGKITGDGGRRVGAPSGSLSFGCSERCFLLSGGSLRSPYPSRGPIYQALKPPPLKNAQHEDVWIVQNNLLAIDIGRVVRFGSLCEAFALFEPRYPTLHTVDILTIP